MFVFEGTWDEIFELFYKLRVKLQSHIKKRQCSESHWSKRGPGIHGLCLLVRKYIERHTHSWWLKPGNYESVALSRCPVFVEFLGATAGLVDGSGCMGASHPELLDLWRGGWRWVVSSPAWNVWKPRTIFILCDRGNY